MTHSPTDPHPELDGALAALSRVERGYVRWTLRRVGPERARAGLHRHGTHVVTMMLAGCAWLSIVSVGGLVVALATTLVTPSGSGPFAVGVGAGLALFTVGNLLAMRRLWHAGHPGAGTAGRRARRRVRHGHAGSPSVR